MRPTSSSPSSGAKSHNENGEVIDFASAKANLHGNGDSPENIIQMLENGEITDGEYAAYAEYYGYDPGYEESSSEPAEASSPRFKFESDGTQLNTYSLGVTIIIAVGLAIFFCGVAFKLPGLCIVGVVAIALSILMSVFHYRSNAEAERRQRDKTVEKEVESFKLDLYKTLVGYDLHVSQDEIDELVEQYRMDRIAAETSLIALNPFEMIKLAISKTKEANGSTGKEKKKSKRPKRKNRKKEEQQAMSDAISEMSDEEIIEAATRYDANGD